MEAFKQNAAQTEHDDDDEDRERVNPRGRLKEDGQNSGAKARIKLSTAYDENGRCEEEGDVDAGIDESVTLGGDEDGEEETDCRCQRETDEELSFAVVPEVCFDEPSACEKGAKCWEHDLVVLEILCEKHHQESGDRHHDLW